MAINKLINIIDNIDTDISFYNADVNKLKL